jgi:hypothetical protein
VKLDFLRSGFLLGISPDVDAFVEVTLVLELTYHGAPRVNLGGDKSPPLYRYVDGDVDRS